MPVTDRQEASMGCDQRCLSADCLNRETMVSACRGLSAKTMAAIMAQFDSGACSQQMLDLADLPAILRRVLLDGKRHTTGLSELEFTVARIVARKLFGTYPEVSGVDRFRAAAQAAVDRLTLNKKFLDSFDPRKKSQRDKLTSILGFVVQQIHLSARDVLNNELGLKRSRKARPVTQVKGPPNGASPGTTSQARAGPVEALRGPGPRNSLLLSDSLDYNVEAKLQVNLAGEPNPDGGPFDGGLELVRDEDGTRRAVRDAEDLPDQSVSLDDECAGWRRWVLVRQNNILRRLLLLHTLGDLDHKQLQALRILHHLVGLNPKFFPQGDSDVCDRDEIARAAGQANVSQWATNYCLPPIIVAARKDPSFKADMLRLCDELDELEASYKRRDDAKPKGAKKGDRRRDPTKAWTTRVFHLFTTTSIRKALESA